MGKQKYRCGLNKINYILNIDFNKIKGIINIIKEIIYYTLNFVYER